MADIKWIKITTDIFDDEKIKLIEALPEADSIIVIWFKLLCLAGKQNNSGIFMLNDKIAYTDRMLSAIFRRKETVVNMALQTFEQYGMIEIIDGVITIPNWDKHQSLDAYEKKKERDKAYQAERRNKQKQAIAEKSSDNRLTVGRDCSYSLSISKSLSNSSSKSNKGERFFPDDKLNEAFKDYIENRKNLKKPMTDKAIELALTKLAKLSNGDNDKAIEILNQSILNGWAGLFELKTEKQQKGIDWDSV